MVTPPLVAVFLLINASPLIVKLMLLTTETPPPYLAVLWLITALPFILKAEQQFYF
jgi:hypothetical protein